MIINTKYFGEMELEDNDIVCFPNGIFGFEDYKHFVIIRFDNDSDSLLCLQSITDETLAFVMMNPFNVCEDYSPMVSEKDISDLQADSDEDLVLYAITVVRDNFEESTINLKCPIVVNGKKKLAKQVILEIGDYSLRHSIIAKRTEE